MLFVPKRPALLRLSRRGLLTGAAALAAHKALAQGVPGISGVAGFVAKSGAVTTWNPRDAGGGFSFFNSNLSWSCPSTNRLVRSTTSKTAGKAYFELTLTSMPGLIDFGVGYASASLSSYVGGDANGWGFVGNTFRTNGVSTTYGATYATGNVVGIAVDFGASLIWKAVQGTWAGNPAAGTGGMTIGSAAPLFAMSSTSGFSNTEVLAANFGQSAFTYTPPSGFSAWG